LSYLRMLAPPSKNKCFPACQYLCLASLLILVLACWSGLRAQNAPDPQDRKTANPAAAPPPIAIFVHQEISPGKFAERQNLENTFARMSDRLSVPSYWVDWQGLTGYPEAVLFHPLDSFEQMGQIQADLDSVLAAHSDLAQLGRQIEDLVVSEHTIIAARRDDLGYLTDDIDMSEARFMRVVNVLLLPGRELDFAQAMKTRADLFTKMHADVPWVVYQAEAGTNAPAFVILIPMKDLKQNDDLLQWEQGLEQAAADPTADSLRQIAGESYASMDSNLYVVNAKTSHVSSDFSSTDPDFWRRAAAPEPRPDGTPDAKPKPQQQAHSTKN